MGKTNKRQTLPKNVQTNRLNLMISAEHLLFGIQDLLIHI